MSKKRMKKTLQTITTLLLTAIVVFTTFGMDLPVLAKGVDDDVVIVEEDTVDVDEDIDADVDEDIDADVDEDIDADVDEDVDADVDEDVDADVDEDVDADSEDDTDSEIFSEYGLDTEDEYIDMGLEIAEVANFNFEEEVIFEEEGFDGTEVMLDFIDANIADEDETINACNASSIEGDKLAAVNRPLYNGLKQMLSNVANGKQESTIATFKLSDLGWNKKYTAADLGVSALVSNGTITNEAKVALEKKVGLNKLDLRGVWLASLGDCPYERYWCDLSLSSEGLNTLRYIVTADRNYIYFDNTDSQLKLKLKPSSAYSGTQSYTVNTTKTKAVKSTISMVNTIVKDVKSKSDREKIDYYKKKICDLNTYNTAAVKYNYAYGDPWQIVYVFDGDPNTNVVCEGYSKAFMYLCDKTNFKDSEISCYCVSGDMVSEDGSGGAHMWNIIHWNNGKNYLVDVTNSDGGLPDDLYMAKPVKGSVKNGYGFKLMNEVIMYYYDEDTLANYTTKQLTIGQDVSSGKLSNIYVNYDPYIVTNSAAAFTVIREGGSDNCKFKIATIKDASGKAVMSGEYSTGYQKDNVINLTFYKAGTYTLKFGCKDTDGTAKTQTVTIEVKQGKVDKAKIKKFVERFYTIILGRKAETDGLNYWTNALANGEKTGCDVALGFIRSEEFLLQQTSNSTYVKRLYKAFFNRNYDDDGYNTWMKKLKNGASREEVLAGFVNSKEFKKLCTSYGIRQGYLDYKTLPPLSNWNASKASDAKINAYVKRLYTVALGRTPSSAEVTTWRKTIKKGKDANGVKYNAAQVASRGFFESPEYTKKKKSDEAFIKDAYKAMFGRNADADGLKHWKKQLKNGMTRRQMLEEGFGNSTEFIKMMESYGFVRVP